MTRSRGHSPEPDPQPKPQTSVNLTLSPFVAESVAKEAERQNITVGELISYAIVYYLSDLDSGRVAARRPPLDGDSEESGGG